MFKILYITRTNASLEDTDTSEVTIVEVTPKAMATLKEGDYCTLHGKTLIKASPISEVSLIDMGTTSEGTTEKAEVAFTLPT